MDIRRSITEKEGNESAGSLPFLKLPTELRFQIYKHIFIPVGDIGVYEDECLSCDWHFEVQLLCVCKQVHGEALPILYGGNRFLFYFPHSCLTTFLNKVGPAKSHLRDCKLQHTIMEWEVELGAIRLRTISEPWEAADALISCCPQLVSLTYLRKLGLGESWGPYPNLWVYLRGLVVALANRIQESCLTVHVNIGNDSPFMGVEEGVAEFAFRDSGIGTGENGGFEDKLGEDGTFETRVSRRVFSHFKDFEIELRLSDEYLRVLKKMNVHTEFNGSWMLQKQERKESAEILTLVRAPPASRE